jgi:tape measure domain-containing protein
MAGLGSFFLEIGVDSAALQRGLNNAESRLSKFGQRAEKIGTSLSLAISAPLALVGKNALQTSAQFESLEMSFGTMLRSMENGKTLMKDLQNYNLATSFQFEEVAGAGKSLLAFGFAQQQIIPQMKMIGDISAGVGINIKDLAEIYGKARVQGRLFAEDINQLTGRGIPIIAELAKQFGVSEQAVKKLTEDGKIGFGNLEKAFASLTSEGGQFYNMTANQSTTLGGIYSNLQDSVTQNLRTIGDSIVKNLDLKTVIPQASKYLTDLAEGFSKLSPEAQKAIVVIGGLAIVLPPLLALAGTVLPAIASGFAALISPAGLVGVAIGGAALYAITHWSELQSLIDETSDSLYRNMLTLRHYLAKGRDLVQIGGNAKELAEIEILAYQYKNKKNPNKMGQSVVDTASLGTYYDSKDVKIPPPRPNFNFASDAEIKEALRVAEETFSLRKTMQSQTRDLIIASMEDETKRAKAEAQKRAEEEISAMREKMIGLKNLESEFANWRLNREAALANELVKIQRESFVTPKEIKSKGLSLPPVIRRTLSLDTDKMQSDSERGAIGRVLGMNIGIEQWTTDSATYIAKAQGIVDANARIKNSVGEIALAAGEAMGATIAQMAMGTATITDLANSLLATVGNIFADILKQMALAEVKALGIKALLGDPTALLRVVGLSVGAGLLGAFSSKIGQGRAGNQTQRNNSQPSYSVTRGSNIYTANKQYETIRNF